MNPPIPPEKVAEIVTPEPPKPVELTVAGAPVTITQGKINGVFHPIPMSLFQCILGFQRQVAINDGAESVTYHRWHEGEQRYHSLIPYQNSTRRGLSVKVDWKDTRNIALLDEYGKTYKEDFLPCCTIHSHVDIAAFESGTDAADEEEQPGWHITLGHLVTKARYDFDFRMRIPATKKIKALVNPDRGFKLEAKHLFAEGFDNDFLHTMPGSTDWHQFIDRVNCR